MINASGATWWPNLHPILLAKLATYEITQVMDLIPGSVVPLAMFLLILTSFRVMTNLKNCLRAGVEALEGDGGEPKTSDCPLARPQGKRTYHHDDLYLPILTFNYSEPI